MSIKILIALCSLVAAGPTFAGDTLYGVTHSGGVYELSRQTGEATFVAETGHGANSAASYQGYMYTAGAPGDHYSIYRFDPLTNTTSLFLSIFGAPEGSIRGLAFGSD